MEEYSRRIKIKKSEKFDKITSDGVGSLAENASIERQQPRREQGGWIPF